MSMSARDFAAEALSATWASILVSSLALTRSYWANMPGVAARSATFEVVAWPRRVPFEETRDETARPPAPLALRLSRAAPSTPISAASHTESSSEVS